MIGSQSAKGQVRHAYSTSILSLGKVGQKFLDVACEHKHKPNQKYKNPNVMRNHKNDYHVQDETKY